MPVNFPDSLDTLKTLFNPFNRYKWRSLLKVGINESETVLILTDTSDIPAQVEGNYIGIDDEIMFVESVDNSGVEKKVTVIRARGDSLASVHYATAEVVQCHTAELHNRHNEALIAIENYILSGILPPSVTVSVNASPFTYAYTSVQGQVYTLTVSVKTSDGLKKVTRAFTVNHFIDRNPDIIDGAMAGELDDINIEMLNITTTGFDIVITGANGGSAVIAKLITGKAL